MNLLTNAVKYTEKGTVTFSIREMGREGDQIDLLVSVKDTGIGIRQEDMGKLFEPFDRIEEKRNRNIEGTGLGMAIVNRLLPMMGGELHVESVYGEGSEFFFTLRQGIVDSRPVGNYVERLRESEVQSVNGPSLYVTGARVLVVDDNETNLKVAENLLGLDGIIPDLAQSGTDAIALIRESCYDIIFLDHMMPEMDGIETLQELRNRNLLGKETVVIALTANAIVGAKETYLAAGFDDYLSKPIEFSKLEEQLLLYLPKERCRIVYGSNGDGARLPHTGSGGNRKKDDAQDEPAGTDEILASLAKHGIHTDAGLKYSAGNTDSGILLSKRRTRQQGSGTISITEIFMITGFVCMRLRQWQRRSVRMTSHPLLLLRRMPPGPVTQHWLMKALRNFSWPICRRRGSLRTYWR